MYTDEGKGMDKKATVSPIEEAMSQLATDIDRMTNAMERLHNRLTPVLVQDDPGTAVATPSDPTRGNASVVARTLENMAYQVRSTTDRVQYVIDSLDV